MHGPIISHLLQAEPGLSPSPDYLSRLRNRSIDPISRQDSINWILKVNRFHGFQPVTAALAVSYVDRFLSCHSLPSTEGWPMQLLAVACIAVAAKMEEPQVPALLDLQAVEPMFVFDPRTVQRMELLLMSALQWRMGSITSFNYVDIFAGSIEVDRFGFPDLCARASDLILATYRVVDFLEFRPSAISAAAIICAVKGLRDEFSPIPDGFSVLSEALNIEAVKVCCRLMNSYLADTCPSAMWRNREPSIPVPGIPVGVLHAAACPSCETARPQSACESMPAAKRHRIERECTGSIDIVDENKIL